MKSKYKFIITFHQEVMIEFFVFHTNIKHDEVNTKPSTILSLRYEETKVC